MKKLPYIITLFVSIMNYSQSKSLLEKSVFGSQLGIIGINFYNESRLDEKLALRTEASLNLASIWGGDFYPKTGYIFVPSFKISPRFYYNIDKRESLGRNIKNNSANFVDLSLIYSPNWMVISNVDNVVVNNAVFLIPNWGIRRNFAHHFNYEFNIGLGLGKTLIKHSNFELVPSLGFRLGYDF